MARLSTCMIVLVSCLVFNLSNSIVVKPADNSTKMAEETEEKKEPAIQARSTDKKDDYYSGSHSFEHPHYSLPGEGYGGGGYYDHHYDHYGGHHHGYNDLALKGLLVPLAGVALLGAAAIFASNPLLLQLGVISGKRRRRDTSAIDQMYEKKIRDMQMLERFIDQLPKEQVLQQEQKLLASYLECSEINSDKNRCLERLTCEIQKPRANVTSLERHVLSIVTGDIMNNQFIPQEMKFRVHAAKKVGLKTGDCSKFHCREVDDYS